MPKTMQKNYNSSKSNTSAAKLRDDLLPDDRLPDDLPQDDLQGQRRLTIADLLQTIQEAEGDELARFQMELGLHKAAGCHCEWDQKPKLEDPVLNYDMAAQTLSIETKVTGKIKLKSTGGASLPFTATSEIGIDLHMREHDADGREVWDEVYDELPETTRHPFTCTSTETTHDFSCVRKEEFLRFDARHMTGKVLPLLLEVYWKVSGCGSPEGGFRQYRLVELEITTGDKPKFKATLSRAWENAPPEARQKNRKGARLETSRVRARNGGGADDEGPSTLLKASADGAPARSRRRKVAARRK